MQLLLENPSKSSASSCVCPSSCICLPPHLPRFSHSHPGPHPRQSPPWNCSFLESPSPASRLYHCCACATPHSLRPITLVLGRYQTSRAIKASLSPTQPFCLPFLNASANHMTHHLPVSHPGPQLPYPLDILLH